MALRRKSLLTLPAKDEVPPAPTVTTECTTTYPLAGSNNKLYVHTTDGELKSISLTHGYLEYETFHFGSKGEAVSYLTEALRAIEALP